MELRGFQSDIIGRVRERIAAGTRRILVVGPCGMGKTILAAHMIGNASKRGKRCAFGVHRRELVRQTMDAFHFAGIRFGAITSETHPNRKHGVQIASIPTWRRRINRVGQFDLIVVDEAHRCVSPSYTDLLSHYPDAIVIGLTATPERLDGRGLGEHFDCIVEGPPTRWLIEHGYLSPARIFTVPSVITEGLHTRMGDFAKGEMLERMNASTVTGDALEHYQRHAAGRPFIGFEASRERSRAAAEYFTSKGVPCRHVDGDTPKDERDQAMADFRARKIVGLWNVELFGEGVDVPEMECSIHCRPTQSLAMWIQQSMRPMRYAPGKTAVILDHAGNFNRHGSPDAERRWTLEGRVGVGGGNGEAAVTNRVCTFCFATSPPTYSKCRSCGKAFPVKSRAIEEVDGELTEVEMTAEVQARFDERDEMFRQFIEGSFEDFDQLVREGKRRGYRNAEGWALHIIEGRQRQQRRASA